MNEQSVLEVRLKVESTGLRMPENQVRSKS